MTGTQPNAGINAAHKSIKCKRDNICYYWKRERERERGRETEREREREGQKESERDRDRGRGRKRERAIEREAWLKKDENQKSDVSG